MNMEDTDTPKQANHQAVERHDDCRADHFTANRRLFSACACTVQPELVALAEESPDSYVRVIIQKRSASDAAEKLVADLGGVVVRDLNLINSFSAEVPASAVVQLAESDAVKWISLDAPMRSTQVEETGSRHVFTAWSRALGVRGPIEFDYPQKMVDSVLGPNGTYSIEKDGKAYLGGFVPEITLGEYALTKVEVVLHAYAAAPLSDGDKFKFRTSVANTDYGEIEVGPQIFNGRIGAVNVGPVYVDITGTKPDWGWTDFANRLEIKIDQKTSSPVYYDAVGLRVTSVLSPVSVAWATALGTKETNTFMQPEHILDAYPGPAGTFGFGDKAKASFAGFGVDVSPGFVVRKVEAVVEGYAIRSFSKSFKFKAYVDGRKIAQTEVSGQIFGNHIGAANAGQLYIDITGDHAWQWGDFDNHFEVVIDQGAVGNGDVVYYDVVGLRVWTKPGDDPSGYTPDPSEPDSAVDASRQVNVYNQVIGAEKLWNLDKKLQGKDVAVAVVDSDVFKTGDLSGTKLVGVNFNRGYHDSRDRYGHGTFVAGVIAGNGGNSHGIHIGVAPKARIVNVRVSDDAGGATASDVVAGLQWVYENAEKYDIRVVNLSLNSSVAAPYVTDPLVPPSRCSG